MANFNTINTNISAMVSQRHVNINNADMAKAMERLSSGKRINSAGDDAAGIAIGARLEAQERGLRQAIRNANDGAAMLATAEGASQEVVAMLQRMRELAVQASNATNSSDDWVNLQAENDALVAAIDDISTNTEWNSITLLDGTSLSALPVTIGGDSNQNLTLANLDQGMAAADIGVDALVLATGAAAAISDIDVAINDVTTEMADMGAYINRLEHTVAALDSTATNTAASKSRIVDAEFAVETTALTRGQILSQAATAVLAQANQNQQSVLALLQ